MMPGMYHFSRLLLAEGSNCSWEQSCQGINQDLQILMMPGMYQFCRSQWLRGGMADGTNLIRGTASLDEARNVPLLYIYNTCLTKGLQILMSPQAVLVPFAIQPLGHSGLQKWYISGMDLKVLISQYQIIERVEDNAGIRELVSISLFLKTLGEKMRS